MRIRKVGLVALTGLVLVAAAACNNAGSSGAPAGSGGKALKIGLVTDVGGLNDKSFNEASWAGTQAGATKVGGSAANIVTKAPADYAANIKTFIDQKYDVIVTVGFALGDATLKAATANPTVKFIGVDQFICVPKDAYDKTCGGTVPPNYQGVIFVEAQAGYLVGVVAGSLTKSNVIGAVGGINTVPPVVSYIRGYQNGALSVNPKVNVLIQYADTDITKAFNEPDKGKTIAEQMIAQKADWLFQVAGGTGVGVLQAACAAPNTYGIGVDVDQAPAFPDLKCVVTSAEKHLASAIQAAIERIAAGTDKGGNIVNDAKSDPVGVGISDFHALKSMMTPDLQAKVDAALKGLKDGSIDPCKPNACTP